jgi:hypothetical protein
MILMILMFFDMINQTQPQHNYNIFRLQLFVQLRDVWWCYAIDMKQHKVFIIEPTSDGSDKELFFANTLHNQNNS